MRRTREESADTRRAPSLRRRRSLPSVAARASLRSICAAAHVTTGALYFLFAGKGELFERALGPSFDQVALSLRIYYRREQTSLTLGKEALKGPTSPDGRQCTGTLAGS